MNSLMVNSDAHVALSNHRSSPRGIDRRTEMSSENPSPAPAGNDDQLRLQQPEDLGSEPAPPIVRTDDSALTEEDLSFPDELESRVRRRADEVAVAEEEARQAFKRQLRESFGEVKSLICRRILQVFSLMGDLLAALRGGGSRALMIAKQEAKATGRAIHDGSANAGEVAGGYLARAWRRARGAVLLYRIQKVEGGFFERTAIFIDRVDLESYLAGSPPVIAAIVLGRFDRTTCYSQGKKVKGLMLRLRRHEEGNLFALRCSDAKLPALPAGEILQILSRHPGGRFYLGHLMAPLLRSGLNAEAAVGAANRAAKLLRQAGAEVRRLRAENRKLAALVGMIRP